MTRIRLNMIVKDEAPVIGRCLSSLRPYIDAYTIVDTGSTDGTQDVVRQALAGLPGSVVDRPWHDFGYNRTEAIGLAIDDGKDAGEYLLFIDADERLEVPAGFAWPELIADAYHLPVRFANLTYARTALVSTRRDWRYVGVLHEYLDSADGEPVNPGRLPAPTIVVTADGARSRDPLKYEKDAALLEAALLEAPDNARYVFYLAQSYRDAGLLHKAADRYSDRARMGGWDEEVWYSLFQMATMAERLGWDAHRVIPVYLMAFNNRPSRAEPLVECARYCRSVGMLPLAFMFAQRAAQIPFPPDKLFVDHEIYEWRALDELGISAYYAGAVAAGRDAIGRLLTDGKLPLQHRERVSQNLAFY